MCVGQTIQCSASYMVTDGSHNDIAKEVAAGHTLMVAG